MPRPRSRVRYQPAAGLTAAGQAPAQMVPTVDPWTAGEMFVSPHVHERRRGFNILCGSEAARASALACHLLASRVDEPDLALRADIVHVLGDYFELREREFRYPPEVRGAVSGCLRKFDRPQVAALVELYAARRAGALAVRPDSLRRLFERIPDASAHLVRMAGDRNLALPLRQAALEIIGLVGFLDARPALDGLRLRLEGRQAGQLTMLFAPTDPPEDAALLPVLRGTLTLLDDDE